MNRRCGLMLGIKRISSRCLILNPSIVTERCLAIGDLDLTQIGGSAGRTDFSEKWYVSGKWECAHRGKAGT